MINKKYLEPMFNPDEYVCIGNKYENRIFTQERSGEFISINPLSNIDIVTGVSPGRRADLNVTSFRNFLFEVDSISVDKQLDAIYNLNFPYTNLLWSGSKSIHIILSLETPLEFLNLNATPQTASGIDAYKQVWNRLRAYLDLEFSKLGLNPAKGSTIIDTSCKNPSRFTRFPMYLRDNGNFQTPLHIGSRLNRVEFENLLEKCPKVLNTSKSEVVREFNAETEEQFWSLCSPSLLNHIKYPNWASGANMYPVLYKLSMWAIDETGIDFNTFLNILHKYTFPHLLTNGYPANKLEVGVKHAFRAKNLI